MKRHRRSALLQQEEGSFISTKTHLCAQLPLEWKDAMWNWECLLIWCRDVCRLCTFFTSGGCSEVAAATSYTANQCLEVGESRREGEVGERERDR